MEYRKIKGIKHYVFEDYDEFRNHFDIAVPDIVIDWRNAEEGDWVYSDDDRIVQILKKNGIHHPNDRKNYRYVKCYVRTVVGTFLLMDKTYMDTNFSEHSNRYTFSKTIKNANDGIKQRKTPTKKEKIFATNIAVGMGAVKAYMDAFNESVTKKARSKATILLKQERVMKEVEKSVLDVAKGLGLDHEYILEKLKCLIEGSQEDTIVLNALKEAGKAIGTFGITTKQREVGVIGMFSGFEPDQLDTAKRPQLIKGENTNGSTEKRKSKEIISE